jgi:WD40 repeat protein
MPSNQYPASKKTMHRIKHYLWGALAAASTVMLLNCGGGGGSNAQSGAGEVTNQAVKGRFWQPSTAAWHVHYITDAGTGNTIRTSSRVYDSLTSVALDGRLFVSQNIGALSDTTVLTIHPVPAQAEDTAASLRTLSFSTTIQRSVLSPDSRYLAIIYADGTGAVSTKNGLAIYDLQNQTDVNTIDHKRIHDTGMSTVQIRDFSWLPRGEYRYLYFDDRIMAGSAANPTQPDKPAGKIVAPAGYETDSDFAISPDGKQIATTFAKNKKTGEDYAPREVWFTDITGGNPERVTTGVDATSPVWSPDGQFISVASGWVAKTNDRVAYVCRRKYIPSTARNVTDEGARRQIRYTPFNKLGVNDMGCPPIDFAWTK